MRSGTGRHRRPRQAPAIVVAAGVTGAGIALPLLGASAAHAADTHTWDRVAECESGGMWSANSGNGFYGGLQLTLDMWKTYGGTAYAPRPDLASRSQQIAVAETMLRDRGPQGWPACALDAGLTEGGAAPEVNPGRTTAPLPDPSEDDRPDTGDRTPADRTGPADRTAGELDGARDTATGRDAAGEDRADRDTAGRGERPATDADGDRDRSGGTGDPDGRTGDRAPAGTDGRSGEMADGRSGEMAGGPADGRTDTPAGEEAEGRSGTAPGDAPDRDAADPAPATGTGKHRGAPDDRPAGDGERGGGRHADRSQQRDTPGTPGSGADRYTVRPGDNLSVIAEDLQVPGGWPALYDANEKTVGDDPDLIHPGQRLVVEEGAGTAAP
ncbi:transglycosylase family protein [Streptomyces pactum]|uniref:Transglycosylase family protein n=1 Tax=Streptomyces pactum TaxID=68249 RepID=A0ABS0NN28_9ACTN|nr:transglycosylase family protein [Streptomyces pactum]